MPHPQRHSLSPSYLLLISSAYFLALSVKAFITIYIVKAICGKVSILTVAFHLCSLLPHLDKFSNAYRMFPSPLQTAPLFFLSSLDKKHSLEFWIRALFSSISFPLMLSFILMASNPSPLKIALNLLCIDSASFQRRMSPNFIFAV